MTDEVQEGHRLSTQLIDHVPIVDDVTVLAVRDSLGPDTVPFPREG
jgi:hypothetical protein